MTKEKIRALSIQILLLQASYVLKISYATACTNPCTEQNYCIYFLAFSSTQSDKADFHHHQAFFVLGAPPQGMRVNATITGIDTETTHDWVSLLWVDPTQANPTFCAKYMICSYFSRLSKLVVPDLTLKFFT